MLYSLREGGREMERGGAGWREKRMNTVCRYIFSFEQLQPLPFGGEKIAQKQT